MKKLVNKKKGVVKGAPSGLVVSLLVHVAAFLLAGLLVVFTVQNKQEQKFVPPKPVDRPKMKLKKPKVKVKKTAKPRSTTRIVTKVRRAQMPDIQLPEMGGMGESLGGGLGEGFNIMPDIGDVTMFGATTSIGNDLEGTLYDLKRLRDGRTSGIYETAGIQDAVEQFLRSGWKSSVLARYYHSPKKLYTPMIMVPPTDSSLGPWAFGEREMDPWAFLLHYKGQLVHKDGIKFRFVVMGDNYLVIRVNGEVVLDYKNQFASAIQKPAFNPLNYHLGHWWAYASDWIELEPGVPQDVEFILGDYKGHIFAAMVAIEEYGVEYPHTGLPLDNPKLPIFKTANLSRNQIDAVYQQMWENHLAVTNGPVFSDYDTGKAKSKPSGSPADQSPEEEVAWRPKRVEPEPRLWAFANGKSVEAEFVNIFSGKAVLKTERGKVLKVPPSEFAEDDRKELELLNPPKLSMSFKKDTQQFEVRSNPDLNVPVPAATEFAGGVVIEQEDKNNDYRRPLRLEFYVILDEYDGNNFILHDRIIQDFTLTPQNDRRFEIYSRKDIMLRYEHYAGNVRGEKYKGYMVLVFNERDELIAQNLSHDWLLDIRDKLLDFPVGRHFNKQGERVFPPRPIFSDRYWDAEP